MKAFTLDFSGKSGVPSQWGIKVTQVVQWFYKQIGNLLNMQITEDFRRGVFTVTAFSKETETYLSNFTLAEKDGKRFDLPLRVKSSRSKPAVWVTIHRCGHGELGALDNTYFDNVMEQAGATVIKYTERQTYQGTPFWNGKRRVLIEVGDKHVERQQVYVDKEGRNHDWFLTYRGQPFDCRKCDGMRHEDGQCPRWEDRSKKNHEGTKNLSSSQIRL